MVYEENPDTIEDGEFKEFLRWINHWGPLVDHAGSFEPAIEATQSLVSNPVCNGSSVFPSHWNFVGPSNMPLHQIGKVTAVAALPSEPNIVYAGGSYGGGVFRTIQAAPGAHPTWQCITDQNRFKTGQVSDILIDPTNNTSGFHDLFFICQTGVFKSTDNGATWVQSLEITGTNLSIESKYYDRRKLVMDPSNHLIIYCIGEKNEIYKT